MDCHPGVRTDRAGLHQALPVLLTVPGLKKKHKKPAHGAGFNNFGYCSLDSDNVSSRWPFGTVRDFKFYTLAFSKSFETIASDGREVNENVFATIFWSNETETFRFIKPLNATFNLRHQTYL
jgi:hypothetical protein